jgi:ABC-type dipeptide/oligopeptide/nickel transport system permease subunit
MAETLMTLSSAQTVAPKVKSAAGQSLWWHALKKLQKNPTALISGTVIALYLLTALLSATGLIFTNYAVVQNDIAYQAPSAAHWLGTDVFGRDVLARASHGTITSLIVGFFGSGLAVIIGTVLGALSGYFGGKTDDLLVWFSTTIDTIPYILLIAAFSLMIGAGLNTLCLAIGITGWVGLFRIVRAEFLKHRNREYVQSAYAMGASHYRCIFNHILPNVTHLILINFSLGFVSAIKSEVILSYLGLGVEPGRPSWGMMIDDAKLELARGVWWGLLAATIFMFFLVLAFNLFNDALRDALDPKLKNRGNT